MVMVDRVSKERSTTPSLNNESRESQRHHPNLLLIDVPESAITCYFISAGFRLPHWRMNELQHDFTAQKAPKIKRFRPGYCLQTLSLRVDGFQESPIGQLVGFEVLSFLPRRGLFWKVSQLSGL